MKENFQNIIDSCKTNFKNWFLKSWSFVKKEKDYFIFAFIYLVIILWLFYWQNIFWSNTDFIIFILPPALLIGFSLRYFEILELDKIINITSVFLLIFIFIFGRFEENLNKIKNIQATTVYNCSVATSTALLFQMRPEGTFSFNYFVTDAYYQNFATLGQLNSKYGDALYYMRYANALINIVPMAFPEQRKGYNDQILNLNIEIYNKLNCANYDQNPR